MLRQDGKPPKLRAKGAETRHLVPFGLESAQAMYSNSPTPHNLTVLQCISYLMDFYMLMTMDEWKPTLAQEVSRKCLLLYGALSQEMTDARLWRTKPKAHMFAELGGYQQMYMGNPSAFWGYQDEDFVGQVAKLAHTKGGPKTCVTLAKQVLERYRALASQS